MKKTLILILGIYQKIISPALHSLLGVKNACRFEVSCSNYAIQSIDKYGIVKGGQKSLVRLFKCQPFYSV